MLLMYIKKEEKVEQNKIQTLKCSIIVHFKDEDKTRK